MLRDAVLLVVLVLAILAQVICMILLDAPPLLCGVVVGLGGYMGVWALYFGLRLRERFRNVSDSSGRRLS